MVYSNLPVIDDRLWACASFVREGSVICDVGTDHAYIPIYLVKRGICPCALATDINEGPINTAKDNAKKYGVYDKITFIKANGLQFSELNTSNVSDILICGMGGELIADIIDVCEYTRNKNVRLILQPMSVADVLRKYLSTHGFEEIDGNVSIVGGKVYQTIVVEYTAKSTEYTPAELLVGKSKALRTSPLYRDLCDKFIKKTTVERNGKSRGGLDVSKEDSLIKELNEIKENL